MHSAALSIELGARRPLGGVVPASQMPPRPPAACLPTGLAPVDALTGGLPRGALTEVFGAASSGRTSLLLAALAQATRHGEVCALIDVCDSFDPHSAQTAGVDLRRVLWVRCRETRNARREMDPGVENALKAADFLLQAGGFGLVAMDLASLPPPTARRIPLTSWFRFRRAVEHTPTALLVLEQEAFAKSAAGLVLKMRSQVAGRRPQARPLPSHARLLLATEISVEVVRATAERKPPARPASFQTRAQWAR